MHTSRLLAAVVSAGAVIMSAQPASAICNSWQCGANTPILWGTFIRGLSTRGEANAERVVLRPTLILPPGSPCGTAGVTLRSKDGHLRGVDAQGTVVCEDEALIGAAFDLDVPYKALTMRIRLQVTEADRVSSWERDGASVMPTFRFMQIADGALPGDDGTVDRGARPFGPITPVPLCAEKDAWMEAWQTEGLRALPMNPTVGFVEYDNPEGVVGLRWRERTDHALIVSGETYDEVGSQAKRGEQWFQIACAGSAIAKMRLLGVDPWDAHALDRGTTVATLKMLGARYGGTVPYTRPGTPIVWKRWDSREFYGGPDPRLMTGPVESDWRPTGATCVSHLRLLRSSLGIAWLPAIEPILLMSLVRTYRLGPCTSSEHAVWRTTTVDHVRH